MTEKFDDPAYQVVDLDKIPDIQEIDKKMVERKKFFKLPSKISILKRKTSKKGE